MADIIEYKGYSINIHLDESPESPRDWDNLGIMVCFHNRYDLGDKHEMTVEALLELVKQTDIIALPLYLYDHSGIWMRTDRSYPFNCPWDSGQAGYIYVSKSKIKQEYGCKHVTKSILDKVLNVLCGEVDTYSKYISGEVYGFTIDNPENTTIDSCWGFYDSNEMITECKGIVDADLESRATERAESTLAEIGC